MKVVIVVLALVAVAVCQDTTSWTGPIFGNPPPAPTTQAPAPDTTSWTGPIFGNAAQAPTTEAPTTTTTTTVADICWNCVKNLCRSGTDFSSAPYCKNFKYNKPCTSIASNDISGNNDAKRLQQIQKCMDNKD